MFITKPYMVKGILKMKFAFVLFILLIIPLGHQQIAAEPFPELNQIYFAPTGIGIPPRIILLIRKGNQYGAVKFINFRTGKNNIDLFGDYESWYQGDGSGDLIKQNIKYLKGEVSDKKLWGIGRFSFSFDTPNIHCGPIKSIRKGDRLIMP